MESGCPERSSLSLPEPAGEGASAPRGVANPTRSTTSASVRQLTRSRVGRGRSQGLAKAGLVRARNHDVADLVFCSYPTSCTGEADQGPGRWQGARHGSGCHLDGVCTTNLRPHVDECRTTRWCQDDGDPDVIRGVGKSGNCSLGVKPVGGRSDAEAGCLVPLNTDE